MSEVTRILSAIEGGDPHAAEQLLPLVYDELRKLAAQKLAQEKPGQTLQATALVHEAYLRLVDVDKVQNWDSRGHFFAAAAEAMRRILVDNARRKKSAKRGGRLQRVELDEDFTSHTAPDELLALSDALDKLAREIRSRPSWSSCTALPDCRTSRRHKPSGSPVPRRIATGPTPKPGSIAKSTSPSRKATSDSCAFLMQTPCRFRIAL
jgi:RNA polymerase sigma factor (TIGR02999 family)